MGRASGGVSWSSLNFRSNDDHPESARGDHFQRAGMLLISIKWKLTLAKKYKDRNLTFILFSTLLLISVSPNTPPTFVNMTSRVERAMHEMMGEDEELLRSMRNWKHIHVIFLQMLSVATNYGRGLSL